MTLRTSIGIGGGCLLLTLPWLPACSGGGGSSTPSFAVRTTSTSWAQGTAIAIGGKRIAFLAAEDVTGPTGTDFNGDMDKLDRIAVVVDTATNQETVLNVAAVSLAWIGDELYIATEEADDDVDWNGDLVMDDLVLLHWSAAAPTVARVDDLDQPELFARGSLLYYSSATAPVGALATRIEVIVASAPMTHAMLPSTDNVGPLSPRILGSDEGLIFLELDETREARDLNGDMDLIDVSVLALLDGTTVSGPVRNTGRALATDSPLRANTSGSHDWQVGFLVDESAQGNTNLNAPGIFGASWHPVQCSGDADVDTADDVLHILDFGDWSADPVLNPPINTGLVGSRRICIASGFVATLSLESDEGTCDLNGDGDTSDRVVRWTQIVGSGTPVVPLNEVLHIHAIEDCPGGTRGIAEVDERFVVLVSEADDDNDIDGGGLTHELLGWLSPSNTPHAWDFTHGAGNTTFVGATTMTEVADRTRLGVAFPENIAGSNINRHTPAVAGEDTDTNDSVPTFVDFTAASTLSFPGVAIAADQDNAGIVVSKGYGFYRVSEAEDSRDWNGDSDETDFILFRTSLSQAISNATAVLNNLTLGGSATNAIQVDTVATPVCAVLIVDENVVGSDVNGDGTMHFVVEYFRF